MSARRNSGRVIDLRGKRSAPRAAQVSIPFFEKKRSPLKVRRRRTRILTAVLATALIGGGVWGLHYASYRPEVTLQSIQVVGAKDISPEEVHTIADSSLTSDSFSYISPRNMFFFSKDAITSAIRNAFPRVASVSVSRDSLLAQTATVTIKERVPYGVWCAADCFFLDENGYIFDELASTSPQRASVKYRFEGALSNTEATPLGQTFLPNYFASIRTLIQELERASFYVQGVRVEDEYDFRVLLDRGYALRASFGAKPEDLVKNLELILASDALRGREGEILYVDLRFGNRVYYKFK